MGCTTSICSEDFKSTILTFQLWKSILKNFLNEMEIFIFVRENKPFFPRPTLINVFASWNEGVMVALLIPSRKKS